MRELTFDRKSVWYRLATSYGPMWDLGEETNICAYLRAVLAGLLVTIAIVTAGSLLLLPFLFTGIWLVALMNGVRGEVPEIAWMGLGMYTVFGLWIGVMFYRDNVRERNHYVERPPGFMAEAYASFKDKTCVRVRFD